MNLYQYIQRKDEIKSKIDELPTAYSYAIVLPNYVNKYSEFFEYMSDIIGIELVKSPVYVKEGDIIEPEHFLNLCDNTRHLIRSFIEKLILEPTPELGLLNGSLVSERQLLSTIYMKEYRLLNTIYSYGLYEDRSGWDYSPILIEDFDELPSINGKYILAGYEGDVWVENSKLYLSGGSYIVFETKPTIIDPNIRIKIDTDITITPESDITFWISSHSQPISKYIASHYIVYVWFYNSICVFAYMYRSEDYTTQDYYIISLPQNINSIEICFYLNNIELRINDETMHIFQNTPSTTGRYSVYFYIDNYNTTAPTFNVDKIQVENIIAKKDVKVGTPVYSNEWNKLKNAFDMFHNYICKFWDIAVPKTNDIFLLDNFDNFPSPAYWNERIEYNGNVYVSDSKLVVDSQSYIKLERSEYRDLPIGLAYRLRIENYANASYFIFSGLVNEDDTLSCGVQTFKEGQYTVSRIIYRNKLSSGSGSEITLPDILPYGILFKDGFLVRIHTPLKIHNPVFYEIDYTPMYWSKFVFHIYNNSPSGIKIEVDDIMAYNPPAHYSGDIINLLG